MKPFYQDNHNTLYCLDFRKNELADESVQMVCTSPPYWGLRKYSGEQELIWGGDKDCEHQWGELLPCHHPGQVTDAKAVHNETTVGQTVPSGQFCSLCGAWKGAYGLEPTPEMYITHTIEILREIKRVLRKDGVVFWNIGDSYFGAKGGGWKGDEHGEQLKGFKKQGFSIKPKDLCLIPFRVAIAAQTDGWWVRSVIIWSKPNPMPESVTDRPTESHEYILMLTKSARYYWDADAVRKPTDEYSFAFRNSPRYLDHQGAIDNSLHQGRKLDANTLSGRNIRSVWEFPTQPYPEAHFAVFPEKLPEICIKAATPEVGCCSKCGAPWERMVEKTGHINKREPAHVPDNTPTKTDSTGWGLVAMGTDHWQPTCKCNADKVPSLVCDPFMGAGTTLWVAKRLNRKAIGYELSEEYCELALERNRQQILL